MSKDIGKQKDYYPDGIVPSGKYDLDQAEFHMTDVFVSDGIKSLGNGAFSYQSMTSISLPETLTRIGQASFLECNLLSEINIPSKISELLPHTFDGCRGLKSIDLKNVTSIGQNCFYRSGLVNLNLPNSVKNLGTLSFQSSVSLEAVSIGSGIQVIGSGAFQDCSKLSRVEIPSTVQTILEDAFRDCTGITELIIQEGLRTVDSGCFSGCIGLKEVTLPASLTSIRTNNSSGIFVVCDELTTVTLKMENPPERTENLFLNCKKLSKIIVPKGSLSKYKSTFSGTIFSDMLVESN